MTVPGASFKYWFGAAGYGTYHYFNTIGLSLAAYPTLACGSAALFFGVMGWTRFIFVSKAIALITLLPCGEKLALVSYKGHG